MIENKKVKIETITEGSVKILKSSQTFYNPSQELNRSLSCIVLQRYLENLSEPTRTVHIYEAMAASGIRSLRYVKEIDTSCRKGPVLFYANDVSQNAVTAMAANLELNGMSPSEVRLSLGDCVDDLLKVEHKDFFDVVDLDPYGSPSAFVYPALRALRNGGLFCLTATDLVSLCKKQPELAFRRYTATTNRGPATHEAALRTVVGFVGRTAAQLEKSVVPLFSFFGGFYVRTFLRVVNSKRDSLAVWSNLGFFSECGNCFKRQLRSIGPAPESNSDRFRFCVDRKFVSTCALCAAPVVETGPLWVAPYCCKTFLASLTSVGSRFARTGLRYGSVTLLKFLAAVNSEAAVPFFFSVKALSRRFKTTLPALVRLLGALRAKGFAVSRTHFTPNAFKTDATAEVVWASLLDFVEREVAKGRKTETDVEKAKKVLREVFAEEAVLRTVRTNLGVFDFAYNKTHEADIKAFVYFEQFKHKPLKSVK